MKIVGDKINKKRPVFEVNKKEVFEGEETIVTTICWEKQVGEKWLTTGECDTVFLDEIPEEDVEMALTEYLDEEVMDFKKEGYKLKKGD